MNVTQLLRACAPDRRIRRLIAFKEAGVISEDEQTRIMAQGWLENTNVFRMHDDDDCHSTPKKTTRTIMLYPNYTCDSDDPAVIAVHKYLAGKHVIVDGLKGFLAKHMDIMLHARKDTVAINGQDVKGAIIDLKVNLRACDFVHLVMCGHGVNGALIMGDQRRLTQAAVVTALREAKFEGHVLVSMNMCESDDGDVGPELDINKLTDPWSKGGELGFQWTWIKSASGNQTSTNAHHFARMLNKVVPVIKSAALTNKPVHGGLQELVNKAWDASREEDEDPSMWMPAPTVASSIATREINNQQCASG